LTKYTIFPKITQKDACDIKNNVMEDKKMKKIVWAMSLIISFICLVATCYAETATNQDSYVKILEIQPNPSVPLEVGSNVDFEVKVEYYVKEDSASIDLVIQKGEYSGGIDPYIGGGMEVLTHGEGVVTLKAKVKVPDTKAIQIFTPLGLQGQAQTSIVDSRFYKVINSKTP